MGDKSKNKRKQESRPDSNPQLFRVNGKPKIGTKEYEAEIFKLQVEMVKLQDWVKATNARIVIIFEGRDAAGQGWHGSGVPSPIRKSLVQGTPGKSVRYHSSVFSRHLLTIDPSASKTLTI